MKEKMSRKSFIVIFVLLFVIVVLCALLGYINRDKEMSDNTHTYTVPVSKYIIVDGTMVFHHDPAYDGDSGKMDSLGFMVHNYGNVKSFNVSNRQQYQLYAFLKEAKPDFMLIRHNGLAPLASKLGIPAAPLGDEHIAIGYQGMVNLGETILNIMQRKKFHEDLSRHITLPYRKWWLEQKDPYILAKQPELIEDYKQYFQAKEEA